MPLRLKLAKSLRPVIRTPTRAQITSRKLLALCSDRSSGFDAFKGEACRRITDGQPGCRAYINLLDLSGRYYYLTATGSDGDAHA